MSNGFNVAPILSRNDFTTKFLVMGPEKAITVAVTQFP